LHVKRQDPSSFAGPGDRVVIKSQLNHSLTEVGKSDILLALDKIKAGQAEERNRDILSRMSDSDGAFIQPDAEAQDLGRTRKSKKGQ